MDRGAWRTTVHGVAKSQNDCSNLACTYTRDKEEPNMLRGDAQGKIKAQCLGFLEQTLGVFTGQ